MHYMILLALLFFASNGAFAQESREDDSDIPNETENSIDIPVIKPERPQENKSIFDMIFGQSDKSPDDEDNENKFVMVDENVEGQFTEKAVVKVIDRSLGKLYVLDIPVNTQKQVNNISIKVIKCWTPDEPLIISNSRAFLEIYEYSKLKSDRLFYGWMLANHPAASYLEHSKYDVSLRSCSASTKPADAATD